MLKSFFFIPAGNKKFYSAIDKFSPDYFIFDLEDSVRIDNLSDSIKNLLSISYNGSIPIFVRLWDFNAEIVSENYELFKKFKNIVLPKVDSIEKVERFLNGINNHFQVSDFKFIILIESSKGLINIESILNIYGNYIFAIGFGSHDYCLNLGIKYDYEILRIPRFLILNYAKAFDKIAIDIACMEINNLDIFRKELNEALSIGYDAKFIIHPQQLSEINNYNFYSENQLREYYEIIIEYKKRGSPAIFKYKGRVIEPPHIKSYQKILNENKWKPVI